ncbi:MAG: OmpA family protein [Prevotellaceae bacterium]|jgi:outer membrane protein OmpA-like peptidoglycan-associated protein|nr:OmpA family protein [Prevotellaceae bacterium]
MKYPAITPDGNYLVFLATDENATIAYESRRVDGKWSEPAPFEYINKLIAQTSAEVGGFSFNHDGMSLFFHAKIASAYFDIFFSRKTVSGWGEPQRLGKPVSMDANLFSPAISSDNKTLFVLRAKPPTDKKKEEECKELLLFEKNREGEWTGPKYLPNEFNIGCQETPFFCADNNILFFSSKREDVNKSGKKVSGDDYNIYYARRIDENNWFYPVYVEDLSSEYNDLSPVMNSAANYFLMSVKAKNAKKQPQKIYTAVLPGDKTPDKTFVLSGNIADLYSKKPVEAKIIVQDAITSVTKGEFQSTDEGRFSIILTKGAFYKIDFSKENYSHTFYYKDLISTGDKMEEKLDVTLFDNVNLELNIYDGKLFYPVSPKVLVSDSQTQQSLPQQRVINVSKGKYNCNLDIGRLYNIRIESDNYKPYETTFDLRTNVVYSDFEKSLELDASRKRLVLNVKDKDGASILPVNIEITNSNRDEDIATIVGKDEAGIPELSLRTNDTYELNVTKKGFTYFNTNLSFSTTDAETMNIVLDALTTETRMVFNNITFETNSAELNAESDAELYRIVKFMKENQDIRIEISAHTDDVGSQEYNARLSDKRAASVVAFLTKNDVFKDRLQAKGYGKLQPLVPNDSAENRAKNRRVEIRIIE